MKPYLVRQLTLTPVDLPFREDALEPVLSSASVAAHYGQYEAYCEKARRLTLEAGGAGEERLEDLVRWAAAGGNDALFNQAAQAWNHAFLWLSFKGRRQRNDDREDRDGWSSRLGDAVSDSGWADLGALRRDMIEAVTTSFGSAWVWLVLRNDRLAIEIGKNAVTPIVNPAVVPLLVVDVWEHAYFLDYGFNRARYAKEVVGLLDWEFAALRVTQYDEE